MNNDKRYVVMHKSTCFGAYFYVLDTDNHCQVSKNMLLKDAAQHTAARMNDEFKMNLTCSNHALLME